MSLIWLISRPLQNYSPGDFLKISVFQENNNPSMLKPAYGKYSILCRYVRNNCFWLWISIVKTCIKVCMSLIWLIQSPLQNYSPGDFMKMRVFQEMTIIACWNRHTANTVFYVDTKEKIVFDCAYLLLRHVFRCACH